MCCRYIREYRRYTRPHVFEGIGWGLTERYRISPVLKHVELKYVEPSECKNIWKLLRMEVTESMLCTFPKDDDTWRKGTYKGDSGGPLILKQMDDNGAPAADISVGLVSWGFRNYHENGGFPGVFGRTSAAYEWIQEEMRKPPARTEPLEAGMREKLKEFVGRSSRYLIVGYLWASRITVGLLTLPLLFRLLGLEGVTGIHLDETISSIRFAALVSILLFPVLLFAVSKISWWIIFYFIF